MIDEFLGMGEISELSHDQTTSLTTDLHGKGKKEKDLQKPGKVFIDITSSDDLSTF